MAKTGLIVQENSNIEKKIGLQEKIITFANAHKGLGIKKDLASLISKNEEAFAARLAAINSAKSCLDLMYYAWKDDVTGHYLLKQLLKAAKRGVKVRLLLDDINTHGREGSYLFFCNHPNMQIRLFNPVYNRFTWIKLWLNKIFSAYRVTRRMHHKAFIVDGVLAIVGGRNIGDSYFGLSNINNFKDLDMILVGPSVKNINSIFESFWNNYLSVPIVKLFYKKYYLQNRIAQFREHFLQKQSPRKLQSYLRRVKRKVYTEDFFSFQRLKTQFAAIKKVEIISDPVEKVLGLGKKEWMFQRLFPLIFSAKNNFKLTAPYFIPDKAEMDGLKSLVEKDCSVNILTNSLAGTDITTVYGAYSKRRHFLLKHGINLFELKPYTLSRKKSFFNLKFVSLHSKAFLLDNRIGFIGSFNFDPRSVALNTEMGIIFESKELIKQMDKLFLKETLEDMSYRLLMDKSQKIIWRYQEDGIEKIADREPNSRLWMRVWAFLVRFLPIHSQL